MRQHHSNRELAIGSLLIMFGQVAQLRRAQAPPDIYIEPALTDFSGGDFFKVKEMLEDPARLVLGGKDPGEVLVGL